MKDLIKKARAYALKNALTYKGKANQGSVISSLFNEGLKKEEVKDFVKEISKIVFEVNSLSFEQQQNEFDSLKDFVSERKVRESLEELPCVKKSGVVMRFRPGPSGALHIGHIISNMPSSLYVKKYGGKFYVIIDDTDPKTIMKESYDWIKRDCDWIFGNVTQYINSSDRIKIYYRYLKKLIEKGGAYVCTCSSEKFKNFSEFKENCPCRNNEVSENLMRWKKMLNKKGYKEGESVLRFKSSMQNPNPAYRDFPLARIVLTNHPLQGNKYRVWPLMNLVVAVDDIELKMTHIIRGKDHRDNAERQKMIYKILGFEKKFPWNAFIGRIKFTDVNLSKRKIKQAIESGEYENFEDEKLPTIISLKKRGYKPEAFVKFIEQRGLTEVDKVISQKDFFKVIDDFNKQ